MRADTLLQPLALLCTRKEVFVSIFPDVAYSEKHSNAGDFVQKYDMSMLPQLLPTVINTFAKRAETFIQHVASRKHFLKCF